ncbi:MAG: leucine-rich repeat domain-containing protein, partial [Clostridia bacterium]|nr:leucine-rich repeat domain-containing protein [Clostridia bacterium]
MKKRMISLLLAILMVLQCCPLTALANDMLDGNLGVEDSIFGVVDGGTTADGLKWTLYDDGILYITGSGDMQDYHWLDNPVPWDLSAVTEVIIADGVTSIGEEAFFQAPVLETVTLPGSVKTIGYSAFYDCQALESLTLSEGLEVIDNEAFLCCPALTDITLPSTVTEIGYMAFAYGGLQTITVLGSEPTLDERVFAGCELTTYANWPSWSDEQWGTVLPIGGAVPEAPGDITWSISADGTVLTIEGSGAMPDYPYDEEEWCSTAPWADHCYTINKVFIGEGITHIGKHAFYDIGVWEYPAAVFFGGDAPTFDEEAMTCSNLLCFYPEAGDGWDDMDEDSFDGTNQWLAIGADGILMSGSCGATDEDQLTWTLSMDGALTISGSGAMAYETDWQLCPFLITSVSLPDGLTTIGMDAFYGCTGLTAVVIPDSVTAIGWNAFRNCTSLTDVTVGSGVQTIDSFAFATTDL